MKKRTAKLKSLHAIKWLCIVFFVFPIALGATFIGQRESDVIRKLGEPSGVITTKREKILLFKRGTLKIHRGVVIEDKLKSMQVYQQDLAKKEVEQRKREAQVAKAKQERYERGVLLKADKMSDPKFLKRPLEAQIDYWRKFKQHHPDVELEPYFSELIQKYNALLDNERMERRMAQLKQQTAEAEKEAAEAKKQANNPFYQQKKQVYLYPQRMKPIKIHHFHNGSQSKQKGLNIQYKSGNLNLDY